MDVSVTGRHCQISEDFRAHVLDKITKVEKLTDKVIRVEVQVSADRHKGQPDDAVRVEITLRSKGPVIRAEAAANDKMAAFEHALDRLMARLRRAADRRRPHHGRNTQTVRNGYPILEPATDAVEDHDAIQTRIVAGMQVTGDGPLIVREKEHAAVPMTLDHALEQMELVGHDFYLFIDAATDAPAVVYRRKAYDYGVIRLDVQEAAEIKSA